jgi:general secretion pathway protein K
MNRNRRKGSALITVLWLSAALSAIAFSVASTVRGETERASTLLESTRAYYLATGAVERALLTALAKPGEINRQPVMRMAFPSGEAIVEIIPETARLSLNTGTPQEFVALLLALGADPPRAQSITAAILDWRGAQGGLDAYYLSLTPSFRPRHASFQEVEEAIYLQGMTPEIFHGNYARDRQGRLVRVGAFKDCVSVYGSTGEFDANFAEPALLRSIGIPPETVDRIVERRRGRPFINPGELGQIGGAGKLRIGGNTIFTFRATAHARTPNGPFSEVSRTVSAQVKFRKPGEPPSHQVLRWDESAYSEVSQWK